MPKKPSESFTSIQILSAKAQSLWAKAKQRMQSAGPGESGFVSQDIEPPARKARSAVTLEIRAHTVVKVALIVLLIFGVFWLLVSIRDTLLVVILASFIAIVIDSSVRRLERIGIPRSVGVLLIYVLFLSLTVFMVASLIPIVANQLQDIARFVNQTADSFLGNPEVSFPFFSDAMNERLTFMLQEGLQSMGIKDRASALFQFGQNLGTVAQSSVGFAVQIAGSVVNFIVNLILILVLAFFIQLERENIDDFIRALLPAEYRGYYDAKSDAVYQKMTQWFQGQLILCVAIGVLVFIALTILGMPYALTLALLAGFTEFIPYAGPLIAALPAIFIALSQKGIIWMLVVAVTYYIVQLCENNLLVPLVMKHTVGLSPIAIIVGMLIGVSFPDTVHPVVGIILAVPATAIITIFVHDFYILRKRK